MWVLADIFENDSGLIQPGAVVRVRYRNRIYRAVMGPNRQFDPVSRTLKVRLDLDNPGLALRPDMFVDVEFDARAPEGISVPADALLDSGRRTSVFVATGDGAFEPREVATGIRYGDRVQILKGLEEGESVVGSGLFLLDSESRLQLAASGAAKKAAAVVSANIDPVCGMAVEPSMTGSQSEYKGSIYRFCSRHCKDKFDSNPSQFVPKRQPEPRKDGQS